MKKTFIIICLCLTGTTIAQSDSITNERLNKLENNIDSINSASTSRNMNFEIDVKDWAGKVKSLDSDKSDIWKDLLFPLISLAIPIGAAIFAGFQAIKQIDRNGRWTLKQSRANTIAEARIEWMQKMRSNLSEFSAKVASINYHMADVIDFLNNGKDAEAKKIYDAQIQDIVKVRAISTEIKLQLNTHEKEHTELNDAIDNYLDSAIEYNSDIRNKDVITERAQTVIDKGRIVLKITWEQAKSEGDNIDV